MLRSIQSTAFLGTILLSGVAIAEKPAPANDDTLIDSSKSAAPKAGAAPAAIPTPPPPVDEPDEEPVRAAKKRTVGSSGLDTQAVTVGGAADIGESSSEKDWGFKFKGFMRAPMRLGISRSVPPGNTSPDVHANDWQFHAPPVTPDSNYTRWGYTNISPGPWAELLFQYGNQRVMMTTSIASYNITSGGWRELQDQLGIDRAFITLKFPEALGDIGGMAWDVGIFSNRYGAMGKYDAGMYETYLVGRTRLAGATATAELELTDDVKLIFEGGGGAKVDQQLQRYRTNTNNPSNDPTDASGDPVKPYDNVPCAADSNGQPCFDYPSWQPNPGDKVQQGTNVLGHFHAGVALWGGILTAQAHYIGSFVKDARWNVGNTSGTKDFPGNIPGTNTSNVPGYAYIQVGALDFKLDGGWRGEGYIGYSYLKAKNALAVNDSIELLHSQGGWQLAHNYFPDGNGEIHSVAGQYTFSLAAFMLRPRPFWGQAVDLTIRPFFMFNKVTGTTKGSCIVMGTKSDSCDMNKLKYGTDIVYSFLPLMAAGLRTDVVNQNMSDSTQSFYVISPRLIFRTEFVTHEQIVLQYSYYMYGSAYTNPAKTDGVMPWPYGQYGTLAINDTALNMKPDRHVITLYASMWW
jgi:hypothetical protein